MGALLIQSSEKQRSKYETKIDIEKFSGYYDG